MPMKTAILVIMATGVFQVAHGHQATDRLSTMSEREAELSVFLVNVILTPHISSAPNSAGNGAVSQFGCPGNEINMHLYCDHPKVTCCKCTIKEPINCVIDCMTEYCID